jgi:hypothetical protein
MVDKLWRIIGISKGGNPVRVVVRALDYFEACAKARRAHIIIRDVVLIEEKEETK